MTEFTIDQPLAASGDGERVVVGMSGGVDSSVAALLLRDRGYEVHGLFMVNWTEDEQGYCTAADDYADALAVASRIGIPLHKVDFSRQYRQQVFAHFLTEYAAGRTPNPDVLCNREIKFGVFLDYAKRLGATRIATGHYARIARADGRAVLLKGLDPGKDQSYFLHAISRAALDLTLFPVGDLEKPALRAIARSNALPTAGKKDSTGICFVGERDFRAFLARFLPAQPGRIESVDGKALGEHGGLMFYTLGQRQGLGLGGRREAADAPWYVIAKDIRDNRLIVGQGHDHPRLFSAALEANELNWFGPAPAPGQPLRCHAKTRYRQPDQACTVTVHENGCHVAFDSAQRAVVPGQYVVFYADQVCLGGGVIVQTTPATAASIAGTTATPSKVT